MTLTWVRPPWRDETNNPTEANPEGNWPWCGDQFLAAVRVTNRLTQKQYWDFYVLSWSETGLEMDGESWGAWSESDIEWITKIPNPQNGAGEMP